MGRHANAVPFGLRIARCRLLGKYRLTSSVSEGTSRVRLAECIPTPEGPAVKKRGLSVRLWGLSAER